MKEYGELTYLKLLEEYTFETKQGIYKEKMKHRNDIKVLNTLAISGWRVVSKEGNTYLMERDRSLR